MGDSIYAGSEAAGKGRAWFAKNSDRHPGEPQALRLVPRRAPAEELRVSGHEFGVADHGYAFLLSQPSWLEGGSMGLNEKGLAVGNEAVFSRLKAARDGVLGMDLLRATLASASSAAEARDFICAWTETHDQGGNGAFRGTLVHSNAYLVADAEEAFIVETAGRRWAWKSTKAVAVLSNAFSIEDDFKRLDAETRKAISPVNEKSACYDESDAGRVGSKDSWRAYVEDRRYLRFSRADARRDRCAALLNAAVPSVGMGVMLSAIRSHGDASPGAAGMKAPCMHEAGFPLRYSTTASLLVEFREASSGAEAIAWFTGGPYPCLSLYAPVLLRAGAFLPLWTRYDHAESSGAAYRFWEERRALLREAGGARLAADAAFLARRDGLQARLNELAVRATAGQDTFDVSRQAVDAVMDDWDAYLKKL